VPSDKSEGSQGLANPGSRARIIYGILSYLTQMKLHQIDSRCDINLLG